MQRIFECFPEGHPAHLPLMLAYHCCMRLGEVFGLTWENVDLDTGTIFIRRQAQRYDREAFRRLVLPKYNSIRRVRMDAVMWELHKREKARQEAGREQYGDKYIQLYIDDMNFLNDDGRGEPIDMVNMWEDGSYVQVRITHQHGHQEGAGLPGIRLPLAAPHPRHWLCEARANLKEIQRRLGHKTLEVTNRRYIHATDLMETQSMDIMNSMYR